MSQVRTTTRRSPGSIVMVAIDALVIDGVTVHGRELRS